MFPEVVTLPSCTRSEHRSVHRLSCGWFSPVLPCEFRRNISKHATTISYAGKFIIRFNHSAILWHVCSEQRPLQGSTFLRDGRCLGRERLSKHVTAATNTHAIGTVFSIWFVPRCYKRWLSLRPVSTRVEAESNTSTVTLRVVGGDEKGSLKSETVKYGRESQGTRTRE
jgi:hypothetical protein